MESVISKVHQSDYPMAIFAAQIMCSRCPRILNFGYILLNWPQSLGKSTFGWSWRPGIKSRRLHMWIGFEQWAGSKTSKREIPIWLLLDFTVGLRKSYFFACSPHGFIASRWSRINLLEDFILVSTLLKSFSFGIFEKSFSYQILVEQGKVQLLLEKLCHFSQFFSPKIRNKLWIF
jgi:hypothetical protein